LPKLADGDYTLKASTWNTTAATYTFTVTDGEVVTDDTGDGGDGGDTTPPSAPFIAAQGPSTGSTIVLVGSDFTGVTEVELKIDRNLTNQNDRTLSDTSAFVVDTSGAQDTLTITVDPAVSGTTWDIRVTTAAGVSDWMRISLDQG
ncbi:hypothetical protein, partial [Nocardioides mangrovi]